MACVCIYIYIYIYIYKVNIYSWNGEAGPVDMPIMLTVMFYYLCIYINCLIPYLKFYTLDFATTLEYRNTRYELPYYYFQPLDNIQQWHYNER